MCDPLTIAVSVGVVAAVGGAGISAYGQYQQGQFQKDMARYQAGLQKQRAYYAEKAGEIEAAQAEKRARQVRGAGLTAFAANGVLLEARPESAAAMWEQDQAKELAWEKELIRTNAELDAWGFRSSAGALRAEGANAAWAGRMGAAGSVLSGVGQAASMGAMASGRGGGGGADGGGAGGWDYSGVAD